MVGISRREERHAAFTANREILVRHQALTGGIPQRARDGVTYARRMRVRCILDQRQAVALAQRT